MARDDEQVLDRNEVSLVGRLPADPEERELPSGDRIWVFRLVVRRPAGGASRQSVDTLDCVAWAGRVQRSAKGWRGGDVVELRGAVRRRFYRTPAGAASRAEIEVASGKVIRRATAA